MLDGKEYRSVVGRQNRAADFRTGRCLEKAARQAAAVARGVSAVEAVGDADRIIVGNDNNLPFSSGRALGKVDDNELILLKVTDLLRAK